jgi:DNA-binding XRE family transcriptional regulator
VEKEVKEALGEKFREAERIGADKTIPVGEAFGLVMDGIRADCSAVNRLSAARAQRKKDVAERLKTVRKAKGMTQQEAAKQTGINVITLSGYEIGRNEPNVEALVRLADCYGVSLDYLACRTDEQK